MSPLVKLEQSVHGRNGDWLVYCVSVDGRYAFDVTVHSKDKDARVWVGKKHTVWGTIVPTQTAVQDTVYQLKDKFTRMSAEFVHDRWEIVASVADLTAIVINSTYDIMLNLYIPLD